MCGNKKPPVEFPSDCLVEKYDLSVIYFVAEWTLYKASKAATICEDEQLLFYRFASAHTIEEIAAQNLQLPIFLKNNDDDETSEVKQLWDSTANSVIEASEDRDDSNNND